MFRMSFAVAALLVAVPAAAAVQVPSTPKLFDALGDTAVLNFSQGYANDNPHAGLLATATFRLTGRAGGNGTTNWTSWTFTIDNLANVSVAPISTARLVSFGFNVDPNVSSISATGRFDFEHTNSSISNGINVEACFKDAKQGTCGGGPGGLEKGFAIPDGNNPINTFTLNFASAQSTITLDKFVVRYQSINNVAGTIVGGSGVGTLAVPEPASWAMLIAGFGLVGAAARRRRTVVAA
jgi:hypothetical protein